MKALQQILNIKPSHFNKDGVASIDGVTRTQMLDLIKSGWELVYDGSNTFKIVTVLYHYPNLMCFGEVDTDKNIYLEGIHGFPMGDECIRYLTEISTGAYKSSIKPNYVYIEWKP